MSSRPGTKDYTVASTAPQPAIYDAHRGVLTALRDELEILAVEIDVDQPWPAGCGLGDRGASTAPEPAGEAS